MQKFVELNQEVQVEISSEFEAQADGLISHYPVSLRSAALPLLYLWQETHGFINNQATHWIAKKLELQPIHILELVTFYPMLKEHAIGKFHILICRTLPCALAGAYQLRDHIMSHTGIQELDEHGFGQSPDGRFSIEFAECLAACGTAPIMMVNQDTYEQVSSEKAEEILNQYT